ncbi:MAG: phosphoglycerate kinase [Nanoarchaeota archaeon]
MYKTLDSYDFKGKKVLVRIDINSEVNKGKITFSERFTAPLVTIRELMQKKAKVVIIAHQGRPRSSDFTSLIQHSGLLKRFIPKLIFVDDIIGNKAVNAIKSLKEGNVLLLENLRFLKEELEPKKENKLVKILTPLFDYYVNDAFSVSHRVQTSITEFPKVLKSCVGRTMELELKNLSKLDIKNAVFILGGDKVEDVALLFNKKHILSAGVPALVCLLAKGVNLGAENERKSQITSEIKKEAKHIVTPVDLAANVNGKRQELKLSDLPSNYKILDIGSETIKQYCDIIKKSKSIFLKGTPGYSQITGFEKGTFNILKAIEQSKAFSVVAGGHSTTALTHFKINKKKIGYISLSGGALVHYVAGKKLPGLEVLK